MRTWPSPHVPAIPGHGYPLRLSDPATGESEPVGADEACSLAICAAGPAGGTHLADVAAAVTFDLVVRGWLDTGRSVRSVQVLLDEPQTASPDELAAFALDMTALGVIPPNVLLRADELEGAPSGAPTGLPAGGQGSDAGNGADAGRRVVVGGDRGHLVCAAAVARHLGGSCDVLGLGSGLDHADGEAITARVATLAVPDDPDAVGRPALGRVAVVSAPRSSPGDGGEGSLLVTDLLERGIPPMAIRLALLARHYRGPGELAPDALERASERLELWTAAVSGNGGPQTDVLVGEVREALADDLDSPRALRVVDAWSHLALSYGQPGGMTDEEVVEGAPGIAARAVDALLGIRL